MEPEGSLSFSQDPAASRTCPEPDQSSPHTHTAPGCICVVAGARAVQAIRRSVVAVPRGCGPHGPGPLRPVTAHPATHPPSSLPAPQLCGAPTTASPGHTGRYRRSFRGTSGQRKYRYSDQVITVC
jgi:hypothetical protein